ncbi:MAG: Gfo/Idh/MocA family oxidoreductase [Pirellulaceae bacterium]
MTRRNTTPPPIVVALITHTGGAHVSAYLDALARADACSHVVLADSDGRWNADARRVLGDKLTATYRDVGEMLSREKPALVLVTMEARRAPPVIDQALEAGCHVFAEKPSCVRAEDFAPLARKADSKHRHLMLALANRLNPEVVKARELIASGAIGKLYGLEMHLVADQTRLTRPSYHEQWFAHKERSGGGHLIWLGIHWLDLAMHITGTSIRRVAGFTANVGGQPIDIEDSAAAALQFDDGALGTITSGYYLDKGYHSHIKIWGAGGWLQLQPREEIPLRWSSYTGEQAGTIQEFRGPDGPRGYAPFVARAIEACAADADPPIGARESLRALRTVFAIYGAAKTGQAMEVAEDAG